MAYRGDQVGLAGCYIKEAGLPPFFQQVWLLCHSGGRHHNAPSSVSPTLVPTDRHWETNTNQGFLPARELAYLEFMPHLQVLCCDRDLLIHSVPICATCPRTKHRHMSYIAAITNRQEARLLQRSTYSGLPRKEDSSSEKSHSSIREWY